jgi:hypothetical protein
LVWKAIKHLLPFAVIAGVLFYWAAAYAEEVRDRQVAAFYERADNRLRAHSSGRLMMSSIRSAEGLEGRIERLRRRFGADGNDLPSFDGDPASLTLRLCAERLSSGDCYGAETRFGVAYAIHIARSAGLDTWQIVMAPEGVGGNFTEDPVRVVYTIHTDGAKVAVVTAEPIRASFSWQADDSIVAQLNSFSDSPLGERLEDLADESGVRRLNRIGLRQSEWRLEPKFGAFHHPFQAEIYAVTKGEGGSVARWLTGEGDLLTALGHILLVSGLLELAWRLLRFLIYTAGGVSPLIAVMKGRFRR